MTDSTVAALVGLAVYAAVRLIDYLLPSGRRFRFMDRWTSESRHAETRPGDIDDPEV